MRQSGHAVGYDSGIAGHYGDIVSSNGSLSNNDLGFTGYNLGSQYANVTGSNWNSSSSPASVGAAYSAALNASQSHWWFGSQFDRFLVQLLWYALEND